MTAGDAPATLNCYYYELHALPHKDLGVITNSHECNRLADDQVVTTSPLVSITDAIIHNPQYALQSISVAANESLITQRYALITQHSCTGSAHAQVSGHVQPVGLGDPAAPRRGQRLHGGQVARSITAHGKQLPAEHREAKAACDDKGAGLSACARQHKPRLSADNAVLLITD